MSGLLEIRSSSGGLALTRRDVLLGMGSRHGGGKAGNDKSDKQNEGIERWGGEVLKTQVRGSSQKLAETDMNAGEVVRARQATSG